MFCRGYTTRALRAGTFDHRIMLSHFNEGNVILRISEQFTSLSTPNLPHIIVTKLQEVEQTRLYFVDKGREEREKYGG